MMLIKKDIIGVNTQKKIRQGNEKCRKIEELGLGGKIDGDVREKDYEVSRGSRRRKREGGRE